MFHWVRRILVCRSCPQIVGFLRNSFLQRPLHFPVGSCLGAVELGSPPGGRRAVRREAPGTLLLSRVCLHRSVVHAGDAAPEGEQGTPEVLPVVSVCGQRAPRCTRLSRGLLSGLWPGPRSESVARGSLRVRRPTGAVSGRTAENRDVGAFLRGRADPHQPPHRPAPVFLPRRRETVGARAALHGAGAPSADGPRAGGGARRPPRGGRRRLRGRVPASAVPVPPLPPPGALCDRR